MLCFTLCNIIAEVHMGNENLEANVLKRDKLTAETRVA